MKLILVFSFAILSYISSCTGSDLIVGSNYNTRLVWQQKVDYMAIPFKKRVKEMFYSDPTQQTIRAVKVVESSPTQASVAITAGGVGASFVNLRFKSQRGSGLKYLVEVYA